MILFQIEETISNVPNVPDMDGEGPSNKKKQALPKQSLLAWAGNVLMKWVHHRQHKHDGHWNRG